MDTRGILRPAALGRVFSLDRPPPPADLAHAVDRHWIVSWDLRGRDPYALYDELCRATGIRHDPCLLDTFIAAVRFMEGEPKKPWWKYTAERKRVMAKRRSGS